MSDLRHALAADLIQYLQQQRQAGMSVLWVDGDARAITAPIGPAAAAPDEPVPSQDARANAKQEIQRRFQSECDRFVQDALAQIARTRAAVAALAGVAEPVAPAPARAAQADLFGAPAPSEPVAPVSPPAPPTAPATAEEIGDPAAALAAIAGEVRACTRCRLHAGRNLAVPGTGNPRAGLVLIGEAPGQEEDRQGLPFVGRSGQLLTDILRAIGFAREDVFIGNVLKCRPPDNRDPQPEEAAACSPYLDRQLAVIRPRLILCLGRIAARRLLGTDATLGSLRRSLHFRGSTPVMVTYHPAALLRNPAQKREVWDDVRKLRALYDALGDPVDPTTV
ncbi:MAG: uracil-DNA glycosylase [Candidatus Krumholzibacteria bacterium]|nr:uracil-DNA glycosylase [Candidatus Krumholzibacteria bacterium]